MKSNKSAKEINLYDLLNVPKTATKEEIVKFSLNPEKSL
jgi:hypothetical protein